MQMLIQSRNKPKKFHQTTLNAESSSKMANEVAKGEEEKDVEEVEGDHRKAEIFLYRKNI